VVIRLLLPTPEVTVPSQMRVDGDVIFDAPTVADPLVGVGKEIGVPVIVFLVAPGVEFGEGVNSLLEGAALEDGLA